MLIYYFNNSINKFFLYGTFHNILFRSLASFFTTLIIILSVGIFVTKRIIKTQISQNMYKKNSITYFRKSKMSTIGGILIIMSILISTLLWNDLLNTYVWYIMFILIGYGIVGFIDDKLKINNSYSTGLTVLKKYLLLSFIALSIIFIIYFLENEVNHTKLIIPLLHNIHPILKIRYIILAYFTIIGTSNAVNLTDGLDGLAIVPIILVSIGLSIIAYITGNVHYHQLFNVLYLKKTPEIIVICTSIIGAGIGFLWFNSYPAQIFMGDTGSLSLGGVLGLISVLLRQELLLIIIGGVFVLETISVIIQIIAIKTTGKKFFLMAPLHHHYELLQNHESKIVTRFWIISVILTFVGLTTLIIF
ncbi:phospho-N-acetylmuramoyl-pentapeptide-transferase [Buchnera aphidicola (Nipponaphis monzeni)]|uniref:Phospho-N-acetylmuramoyl-pentapeptide-transferase n=1 Tax=Buchnera aphidicola (Nipponaphis monzeni) TaxID=2495405 RepID=A0A455TA05_9GAMM|nr:phospho-N-acetylmuramoyl-pentapeptide-transferase [Buchnera aphidicola]BBI01187.1 phospho-N-acetylmuramoyl-pentapeptide-transferase [Buchnera aphidicola (Nipponaphis monzeni)]